MSKKNTNFIKIDEKNPIRKVVSEKNVLAYSYAQKTLTGSHCVSCNDQNKSSFVDSVEYEMPTEREKKIAYKT